MVSSAEWFQQRVARFCHRAQAPRCFQAVHSSEASLVEFLVRRLQSPNWAIPKNMSLCSSAHFWYRKKLTMFQLKRIPLEIIQCPKSGYFK